MKNKLSLLIVSLILSQIVCGQDFKSVPQKLQEVNNDTMQFIKQYIVDRKSAYIGKPLDSLLKDLPPIALYLNDYSPRDTSISKYTTLSFLNYIQTENKLSKKRSLFIVVITWVRPLYFRDLRAAGLRGLGGDWNNSAYNYYKNKIVGNIETFREDSH